MARAAGSELLRPPRSRRSSTASSLSTRDLSAAAVQQKVVEHVGEFSFRFTKSGEGLAFFRTHPTPAAATFLEKSGNLSVAPTEVASTLTKAESERV